MNGPSEEPDSPRCDFDESRASELVRRLGWRYAMALFAVATLVILDQLVLQPHLVRLNGLAPAINLAGRQRMLSQKITKSVLSLDREFPTAREDAGESLRDDLLNWSRVHRGLQQGDASLELRVVLNDDLQAAFAKLNPPFEAMRDAASAWLESRENSAGDSGAAVEALLTAEAKYLPRMDHIVRLLEEESRREVRRLRAIGLSITAAILSLLSLLGLFVVRPATRVIERQWESLNLRTAELGQANELLEARVESRTLELSRAHSALQLEMKERAVAEQQARSTLSQLAHASRVHAVGQLATGLAHELNQPLGAIANSSETAEILLERTPVDVPQIRGNLHRIREAALRAGNIIRRMRNFLRPAASERSVVDLNSLVAEVVELCRAEFRDSHIPLQVEPAGAPLFVEIDSVQIQQVLLNLLQNAAHALRQQPESNRRVRLRTFARETRAGVEVEDNGPGFSVDAATAESPFFTTRADGLGLGLAISRTILGQHQGALEIESWNGLSTESRPLDADSATGSRVRFLLPFAAFSATDRKSAEPSLSTSFLPHEEIAIRKTSGNDAVEICE